LVALLGVLGAAIVFVLNRSKVNAESEKTKAETEKIREETRKLRSETESRQKQTDDTLSQHQEKLDWTVSALSNIVAYMPGFFAHQALCQIHDRTNECYDDSNSHKKRILQLLLDNGYLQPPRGTNWVEFSEKANGKRLFEIAELTPMAKLCLQFKEEVSRKSTSG
jgi:hypothetical protein